MSKLYVLQVIFVVLEVIAIIPLTIEVFGDMNPDIISASAVVVGIGLWGSCVCAVIRFVRRWNEKNGRITKSE